MTRSIYVCPVDLQENYRVLSGRVDAVVQAPYGMQLLYSSKPFQIYLTSSIRDAQEIEIEMDGNTARVSPCVRIGMS